jgi:hypothetical protein
MASQCQIDANRRNAQHSTGPRTEEGKAAARFNAVRHGFTAQLHTGDDPDFDSFRDGFIAEHQPSTPTEMFLVEQMASAAWRLRRLRAAESGHWELIMSKFEDDPKACNSAMSNLNRYESRLESAFYKALHELERLRSERAEEPKTVEPPRPTLMVCTPGPEIGFVSPTGPETPSATPPTPLPTVADKLPAKRI